MDSSARTPEENASWPPGTVHIQELVQLEHNKDSIILHPKPSSDPNDPLNWKEWEKSLNFTLVLLYSLIVFALISVATPTWGPMSDELGFTYEILNDSYAAGTATLCVGALIFIPFALKYGRRPIYIISLALQIAVSIWAAKIQTVADLILINAFNCLLGALAEVIVQMTVADVYFVHERGFMNSIYIWISIVGTSLAPVAGGYITLSQGWRWVWWWTAILLGFSLLLFVFLYEETRFTISLEGECITSTVDQEKSLKAKDEVSFNGFGTVAAGNTTSGPKDQEPEVRPKTPSVMVKRLTRKSYVQKLALWSPTTSSLKELAYHIYQPLVIMFTIPAVFYVALLYGVITAGIQISVTIISTYMTGPPYNFDASQIGLMSLPSFIGTTVGALVSAPLSDRVILYLAHKNHGIYEPEMRLWLLLAFVPFIPAGLLMFGIALAQGMDWPIIAVGMGLFSFGLTPVSSVSLTYLTDAYTNIIADSIVGVVFTRNAMATVFIFALTPWINGMGIQNVFVIFTVITTAVLLGAVFFIIYGKRLRAYTARRYAAYSFHQMDTRVPSKDAEVAFS